MATNKSKQKKEIKKEEYAMKIDHIFKDGNDFQNIQEVEVPDQMNTKIKCGIDFVDQMFGSSEDHGFTPGTITLFTGAPGAGKSTLCLQVINGFASQNLVTAFNSAEEHASQVKKTCDRLLLENPFFVSNNNNVDGVLKQAKDNDVKVLIIDSLQTMGSGKYDPGTLKSAKVVTQKIIQFCKEYFVVGIIICQVTKSGAIAGPNMAKHMVDAHLHLDLCDNPNCLNCEPGTRTLNMQKNRYGLSNVPKQLFLFPQGFKQI